MNAFQLAECHRLLREQGHNKWSIKKAERVLNGIAVYDENGIRQALIVNTALWRTPGRDWGAFPADHAPDHKPGEQIPMNFPTPVQALAATLERNRKPIKQCAWSKPWPPEPIRKT